MQSLHVSGNRINHCPDFLSDNLHERSGIVPVADTVSSLPMGQGKNYRKIAPVVIHVRGRTIKNKRHDFCAVFDFCSIGQEGPSGSGIERWAEEAYIPRGNAREQQPEQFVLVRVLEISKHGEERRDFWIRSVIRLEKLERCLHRITNRTEFPSLNVPVKTGLAVTNGEHKFVGAGRRVLARFSNGNGVHEMIEGAAEIMNAIRDHERPSLNGSGGNSTIEVNEGAVACAIKVCLVGEAIGFSFTPSKDFLLDGFSVVNGMA